MISRTSVAGAKTAVDDSRRRAEIGLERRQRTRQRILQAAFELLGRESGLSTRVEEIFLHANVSRGTFYNHFSNTAELFEALSKQISHQYNVAVHELVSALPSAAERAASALRHYLHRATVDHAWAWAMVNLSAGGPIFGQETFDRAHFTISEGLEQGDFDVFNVELGRDMMLGTTLAAMISLLRSQTGETPPEIVVRQILKALGVKPKLIERALAHPLGQVVISPESTPRQN